MAGEGIATGTGSGRAVGATGAAGGGCTIGGGGEGTLEEEAKGASVAGTSISVDELDMTASGSGGLRSVGCGSGTSAPGYVDGPGSELIVRRLAGCDR